tara:strand:+ start:244 stop:876 length:633 start_codon:yes stop_codon:yes gene_type:complete
MKIAREGRIFVYPLLFMTLVLICIKNLYAIHSIAPASFGFLLLFCLNFFRDPERIIPNEKNIILSPADGKIIRIEKVNDEEVGDSIIISIFLNIFNVHVNRMPMRGSFQDVKYMKGKFLLAFDHKACDENERNTIKISTEIGTIKIVQIAGLLARRIICYATKEDSMEIGERLGFMRFGSRIDLTIPSKVNLDIKLGQKVVGNRTVIGTY